MITWQAWRSEVLPYIMAAKRLKGDDSPLVRALVAAYRLNRETKSGRLNPLLKAWAYQVKSLLIQRVWLDETQIIKSVRWRTQVLRCNRCMGTGWYSHDPLIRCTRCQDGVFKRIRLAEFRFELPERGFTFVFHQPEDRIEFELPLDTPMDGEFEETQDRHDDRQRGEMYPRYDSQSVFFYAELIRQYLGVSPESMKMPTARSAARASFRMWLCNHRRVRNVITLYPLRRLFQRRVDLDDIPF